MTKFSFEVPIKHLHDFDEYQDYIFTLSMLYIDPLYINYVKSKRAEGLKTVWLDNSFNEKFQADDPQDLVDLFDRFDLQKIVVPDDINWTTEQMLNSFKAIHYGLAIPSHSLICVINSMEMMDQLIAAGAEHFAISYWTRHSFTHEDMKSIPNLHFLGLLSIPELLVCRPASCDTSMPIKLALQGRSLRDWERDGYPHINTKDLGEYGMDFFDRSMTEEQVSLARENIRQLQKAVGR